MLRAPAWHLAGFYGSITNGLTNAQIPAVADGILTKQASNNFIMPRPAKLRFCYNGSATYNRVRLNTPSLREVGLPSLTPGNASLTVASPPNVVDFADMPVALRNVEEVQFEGTHDNAAPEVMWGAAWLYFDDVAMPTGKIYRLRGTASITGVNGAWANGGITLDTGIAPGKYAVVGLDVYGANLALARLIFQGGPYRPGVLCRQSVGALPYLPFMRRALGFFGDFDSFALPNLEIMTVNGANTSQTIYIDVIRQGDSGVGL